MAACAAMLLAPALASAHVERAGYWPNPAADTSIKPATGGKVPNARPLASALRRKSVGRTRVVCKGGRVSLRRLRKSVRRAIRVGFKDRPTQKLRKLRRKQARKLLRINRQLRKRCRFRSIQAAVNASRNNDRVVIMPGIYTEPASRRAPTTDPACADLFETNDKGNTGALSYAYQYKCPNDQNLVAVLGREPRNALVEQPPLDDRRGIPDEGPCVRCNLQIEGSGVNADDVIIDAGRVKSGNKGPANPVKDVVLRVDRADGFVFRNATVRHADEHGIYILESDGYLIDRFKAFYNNDYGVLTFVEDHGLMRNCVASGSGDSGLYPGAGADVGENTTEPGGPRFSQRITRCDSFHNASGYSGTVGNAVRVDNNNFFGNALGFTTDVFTAAGHPGFPQDSSLIENNNFYSNNFNVYGPNSDVTPTVPVPVGTGLWIAGGNNNTLRNNRFWNNWRRGVMLFGVPDSYINRCDEIPGCDPDTPDHYSTSHRNRFFGNIMSRNRANKPSPNGTDFWWDNVQGQLNNCWFNNRGRRGNAGSVTSLPDVLPSNCATSNGSQPSLAGPQQVELLTCVENLPGCTWFQRPPKP